MAAEAKVAAILARLTTDATKEGLPSAAADLAAFVAANGVSALEFFGIMTPLKAAVENQKAPLAREGALLAFAALAKAVSPVIEPFLLPLLPVWLATAGGDKVDTVRAAATEAARTLITTLNPFATKTALTLLFDGLAARHKWQTRQLTLSLISSLTKTSPAQMAQSLYLVVPKLTECMGDARAEVAKAAEATMAEACYTNGNKDLDKFIPDLVSCIARPTETVECVHKLSATTFVQAVETPALSIIVPVLERGLAERAIATKRRCAVIIENMCKLVEVPSFAAPFVPKLLPGLERAKEEVSDPECRGVAARAHAVLLKAADTSASGAASPMAGGGTPKAGGAANVEAIQIALEDAVVASVPTGKALMRDAAFAPVIMYLAEMATMLVDVKNFEEGQWLSALMPYVTPFTATPAQADAAIKAFLHKCRVYAGDTAEAAADEDEGEDLCNCEFSLAYGGKILLNTATLHLKRGRRYGLCGPNGVGKSTLMRAIANGQLEGFPSETLRTVYVEHDIQGSHAESAVLDFICADPIIAAAKSREEVVKTMTSLGFTPVMQSSPVTALSGGWRMKCALGMAILKGADILLLDEPTNHLDVTNVAWLVNYLTHLKDVTSIVVSHDSSFLDKVCTDIIHYESFKLKRYRGNLSEFVKVKPEARSYYELSAAAFSFKFPEPGFLEGVNTKGKAVVKLQGSSFTYPGRPTPTVTDVTVQCSLSSRVAVLGPNGAGKSTIIKMLTGETVPTSGLMWKHPNLRIAYVAQHAFHHIEQHLDQTPSEYIQWRYSSGEDKESFDKAARQISEEEEKKMAQKIALEGGSKYTVEQVLNRRKLKGTYEYEVSFVGQPPDKNVWWPRTQLEALGFGKMVDAVDAREAAAMGAFQTPLTATHIAKHMADVGLEPEFTLHSRMRGLSGGQKVKVVLGAAMWHHPHLLVLDEPSNYLDRDSLGALAGAIKEFGGGVVVISHNSEFVGAICSETWNVAEGKCVVTGETWNVAKEKIVAAALADEVTDAAGNVIKVKKAKAKRNARELKKALKERRDKLAKGEDVSTDEELDAILDKEGV